MLNPFKKILFAILLLFVLGPQSASAVILFQDDFTDSDLSSVLTRWEVPRNSCGTDWVLNSGKMGIQISTGFCQTEFAPQDSVWGGWNDYILDVDMTFVGGTDKNIAFRYSGAPDFDWYDYHFQVGLTRSRIFLERVWNTDLYSNVALVEGITNGNTYHLKIIVDGNHIVLYIDGNLVLDYPDAGGRFNTGKIALRAGTGADSFTEVYFDNVVVSSIDVPTPTPTPSPTPTPTSTPPPTNKVVIIPGLGASWNPDALLNCKTDGYSGDWTLAPFADLVYNPLTNALDDYFTVLPYYYDWRKQVTDHPGSVQNFIDANTAPGEDVHLVGHSMGGLVGRAYLESAGENSQLESFLTAGSPHHGSVLSYPAWSAGEVWNDNLFMRIAMTTIIHRCEGTSDREIIQTKIPRVQNLLPTFDYLRDKTTDLLKSVGSMAAQNNWLPTGLSAPFFGVNVGTLSGQGIQTLETIPVHDRNRRDTMLGNWEDGKPAGREKTNDGDGTVLSWSSQLDGADNRTVNQDHGDLVSSSEGIVQILDFLGVGTAPSLTTSAVQNRRRSDDPDDDEEDDDEEISPQQESAVILMGYPARFWITDKSGKRTRDRNGVISLTDPKKGKYKLKYLPTSSRSLFIVAQFYPNDKTLWKEYNFNYFVPRFKTIEIGPENPREDVVR